MYSTTNTYKKPPQFCDDIVHLIVKLQTQSESFSHVRPEKIKKRPAERTHLELMVESERTN